MNVRKLFVTAIIAAAVPAVASATATIVSTVPYALNAGTGGTLITFDEALPAGYTLTGGILQTGSNSSGAAPATSLATDDATTYLSVPTGSATLSGTTEYNAVSLYWGSIDSYNTLELLNGTTVVGTITGSQVSTFANGDQESGVTNRRVTISSDLAFNSLRFTSPQPAFEVDNIQFLAAVPEPATWAITLVGFGMLGASLRRKRTTAHTYFA